MHKESTGGFNSGTKFSIALRFLDSVQYLDLEFLNVCGCYSLIHTFHHTIENYNWYGDSIVVDCYNKMSDIESMKKTVKEFQI